MKPAILILSAMFGALALTACERPPEAPAPVEDTAPAAPELTATTPMTGAGMVDCAGALAAAGNVEIAEGGPTVDTAASNSVWTILALLDKEEPYKSNAAKARADVVAARDAWKARPAAELTARSAACATRFPG